MKLIKVLLFFLLPSLSLHCFWMEDFDLAKKKALRERKYLVLFFTGSDWSKRCQKQEKIFSSKNFRSKVENYFIFCKIDFPCQANKNLKAISKNQSLKEKYSVKHFPTLVFVDPQFDFITKCGYLSMNEEEWTERIVQIWTDYHNMKKASLIAIEVKDLEKEYLKAKEFGCEIMQEKLFMKGLKQDPTPFFLMEEYRRRLENGKYAQENTRIIREEIEARDPKNIYKTHLKLAILDFQTLARQKQPVDEVVAPLIQYARKFKRKDKNNLWRIYLMVCQYFACQNDFVNALKYARLAYKEAPKIIKKEILSNILEIKALR